MSPKHARVAKAADRAAREKEALHSFAQACRNKGLAVTHQRQAIYEAVVASRTHPDAEEIYRDIRKRFPTISRGTVYRTLETLCGIGLVSDVSTARGTARFEAVLEPHHHLICLGCRSILDVHDASLDGLSLRSGARGFDVKGYQIQFVGYCKECRRNNERKHA